MIPMLWKMRYDNVMAFKTRYTSMGLKFLVYLFNPLTARLLRVTEAEFLLKMSNR